MGVVYTLQKDGPGSEDVSDILFPVKEQLPALVGHKIEGSSVLHEQFGNNIILVSIQLPIETVLQ